MSPSGDVSSGQEGQKAAYDKKGAKHEIKPGDWVWRHWPPGFKSKVEGKRFAGPFKVLTRSDDGKTYELSMPESYKGLQTRRVNVANIKPVVFTPDGDMFWLALPPEFEIVHDGPKGKTSCVQYGLGRDE